MLTLVCALIGMKGNAFPVDVEESQLVGHLKKEIKKNQKTITCDAQELQLYLARKGDDTWLESSTDDVKQLKKGEKTALIEALTHKDNEFDSEFDLKKIMEGMPAPKAKEIHVLVVVPKQAIPHNSQGVGRKGVRVDEWFVDEPFSVHEQKRKLDEGGPDQFTRYFKMAGFPPLAHPAEKYSKILERNAYAVIFAELMGKVKLCFEAKSGANMVVTGNPGTGKSRFYLYCIFHLVLRRQEEFKELFAMLDLVLNFGHFYHKYDCSTSELLELTEEEVRTLSQQQHVLRLIEGRSSQLTGWKGVSILFASPGLNDMSNYAKFDSYTYVLPVWSLKELQDYNSLLDDGFQVADDVLISRYVKFGGIPRFIFTVTERENEGELTRAIATFSALDTISYAESNHAVTDGTYSHRVLKMVPCERHFRSDFYLDFLSNYIAEKIVANVNDDSLEKVSKCAIEHANDDSRSTSAVQGKIYEMLCHKWFNLHKERRIKLRSLCSMERLELIIPDNMPMVRFSSLDEIRAIPRWLTYFRPTRRFGVFDAFILDGKNTRCYVLQMTLNPVHGIKAAPLSMFLHWLEGIGIYMWQLYFGFVAPSNLAGCFWKQTIRTENNEILQRPGTFASVEQYVVALDAFAENI